MHKTAASDALDATHSHAPQPFDSRERTGERASTFSSFCTANTPASVPAQRSQDEVIVLVQQALKEAQPPNHFNFRRDEKCIRDSLREVHVEKIEREERKLGRDASDQCEGEII